MRQIKSSAIKIIGKKRDRGLLESWQSPIINEFHKIYYNSGVWKTTTWLGVPVQKCPFDMWIYQEILQNLKPDLVIETGTATGGSALFFATLFDLIGKGQIITIDVVTRKDRPQHPRITYLQGSSTAPVIKEAVSQFAEGKKTILVSLDSDHSKEHVLDELEFYGKLVSPRSYMVVEDTNVNGHPVLRNFGEGPYEAVQQFLKMSKDFVIDYKIEKFFVSFNTHGYLKRNDFA